MYPRKRRIIKFKKEEKKNSQPKQFTLLSSTEIKNQQNEW